MLPAGEVGRIPGRSLVAVLALSLALRLAPYLATGTPFSTDSWSIIRDSLVFAARSPIDLLSPAFDGYNNYWPAPPIALAVVSEVTGAGALAAVALMVSSITASVLLFTALLGGTRAAAVVGFSVGTALMTTAYVKEGYAYAFMLGAVYAMLRGSGRRDLAAAALFSSVLPLAHHLTALVFASLLLALAIYKLVGHYTGADPRAPSLGAIAVALLAEGFAQAGQYYWLGRHSVLGLATPWLAASLFAHLAFFSFAGAWLLPVARSATRGGKAVSALLWSLSLAAAICSIVNFGALGIVVDQDARYVAAVEALLLGSLALPLVVGERPRLFDLGSAWLAALLAIALFLLDEGVPGYPSILYRVLNFSVFPLALTAGASRTKWSSPMVAAYAVASVALLVASGAGLAFRSIAWYWLYGQGEVKAAGFLSRALLPGLSVCTDVKQASLLQGLYGVSARALGCGHSDVVLFYEYMEKYGALVGPGATARVTPESLKPLAQLVYSGGGAAVMA